MNIPASADVLKSLIGFRSIHTAETYTDITDYIISLLSPLGVRCHRLPNRAGTRAGLFAAVGPEVQGGVLLSAHLDVVPVEGQAWTVDPFRATVRDGRIYGRGSCDMKGFGACAVHAMMRASQTQLSAPLKLALSYDEESGCVGVSEMIGELDRTIGSPDICLVGEPTQMQIATGHKGKVSFLVTFRGEAGHSAEAPNHVNALHLAADFLLILRDLQAEIAATGLKDDSYSIPYSTIHVGRLSGGTTLNIIPAEAELEFEIRHLAGDDVSILLQRIHREADAMIGQLRAKHPDARITIEETNRYPGFDLPDKSRAEEFVRSMGGRTPACKVDYGTDGGVFAKELGLPVIVCGPGDMQQGHRPDEFIEISQLAECDAMLQRVVGYLT